jgi:hypothetical protein
MSADDRLEDLRKKITDRRIECAKEAIRKQIKVYIGTSLENMGNVGELKETIEILIDLLARSL